eukprot:CAMPEP_0202444602 /NCGR_PEP_ID=MMETSP1360-20130828/3608_1 /ASSEMBLY_ACC=CAM_ASM_000848 /TAXON_ID=515479 /ORGANISM="Licmophora paradoxa, Strain CCMP2313" /LENGTH=234 /DNA_ID=CAMNT_0049060625 /DNA_START=63 /DNA_END=767 /DNA_ORIENTATION=-
MMLQQQPQPQQQQQQPGGMGGSAVPLSNNRPDIPNGVRFLAASPQTEADGEEKADTTATATAIEEKNRAEDAHNLTRTAPDPLQDPSFLLLQKKAREMEALLEEAKDEKEVIDEKIKEFNNKEIPTPEETAVPDDPPNDPDDPKSDPKTPEDVAKQELKLLEELKQQLDSLAKKDKGEKATTEDKPAGKPKSGGDGETEDEKQRRLTKQRAEFYKNQKKIALRGKMKKKSYMLL